MSTLATDRVHAALAAVAVVDRPEIWVTLRSSEDLLTEAADVDARISAGEDLPLAGLLLAVKNNVDVAGTPTTAACPGFAFLPEQDAEAVRRLRAAGAVVLGSTNLDQFATGLVGTRSPYGAVRDARRPQYISGGSSSGSAVAVALGLADIAIGTDTAGSGRIPAGLQGIVGIKPTLHVVPTDGVVPACRSWDAVTILARDLSTAERAMGVMAGGARAWPADVRLAAPSRPRVAYPAVLPELSPAWAAEFGRQVARLEASGVDVEPVSIDVFLQAARLLYDGALVAERHAAVGAFVDGARDGAADGTRDGDSIGLDPTVAGIISRAGTLAAHEYVADTARLAVLERSALAHLEGFDALLVPTAPLHPLLSEVAADPVGVNSRMGTYTNFCNLFDMCAVAVPAGEVEGAQFGVTVVGRTFDDAVVADIARRIELTPVPPALFAKGTANAPETAGPPWPLVAGAVGVPLVVVGAHRRGQVLAPQLESLGAYWDGEVHTAARYRMVALDTQPPKPGVYRSNDGAELVGERWILSGAALGRFLAALPEPMLLGSIRLADGTSAVGFACDAVAAVEGRDITHHGDWLLAAAASAAGGTDPRGAVEEQQRHGALRTFMVTALSRGHHTDKGHG